MRNPNDLFISVTTDRFVVRTLSENDVTETYLSWFRDEAAVAHIRAAKSTQTLDSLGVFVRDKQCDPRALLVGIFTREASVHIGNLKFEPIETNSDATIIGVLIGDPTWRGKGAFREAFLAAAQRLFSLLGLRTFWLGVETNNRNAIEAYRKTGFVAQDVPPRCLYPVITPGVIYMCYQVGR